MQYSKFLFFLIVLNFGSDSEKLFNGVERIHFKALKFNVNGGVYFLNDAPFYGEALKYYPNGVVSERIAIVNGKKSGVNRRYYPNGKLSYEAHYLNGKKNGPSKSWWKDNILRTSSLYKNGKLDGIASQWYSGGAIFKKLNYTEGVENGLQQAWRENGKLYANYVAKNGRIYGLKRSKLCFELNDERIKIH